MNSTLLVLMTSLLVAIVTARPQIMLPKLIQYPSDSNMLRTTSRPFKLTTPKPVPHKAHTKGGAVISLPSGVVLKAGAELTSTRGGEDNTLSYNNDGFNNVVNHVAGGVLEQGTAEFEYAPNFALPSNINQKLVYVKSPNSDQQIVYVLVPVNSTTATKTPAASNSTTTDENTAGILKFVPPTLKRFFHHFITLRKSFHFFNIFVNSNLYSTT